MCAFLLLTVKVFAFANLVAAITEPTNDQVWLLNCVDRVGAKYSELALYKGLPNGYPEVTVILPTTWNTTVPWEFANITQILPGGTVFTSIEFGFQSGNLEEGTATLGVESVICSSDIIDALYTTTEGSICSSVFQCAPPTSDFTVKPRQETLNRNLNQNTIPAAAAVLVESDQTNIIFKSYGQKVVTDGKLVVGDIFWNVWDERDAYYFSGKERTFGSNGCTVKYEGHGDIEWTTTNGLANTLLTMAQGKDFLQYSSYKKRECESTCEDPRHIGTQTCCAWAENTYWQTHIPSSVDFRVINIPPSGSGRNPSDQGTMTYTIECPAVVNVGCTICKILQDLFGGGSQVGGVGGATDALKAVAKGFGVASLTATVACQIAGC